MARDRAGQEGDVRIRSPREDRALPHQLVLRYAHGRSHWLAVSCNCLGRDNLAVSPGAFTPGEPQRLWHAHMMIS